MLFIQHQQAECVGQIANQQHLRICRQRRAFSNNFGNGANAFQHAGDLAAAAVKHTCAAIRQRRREAQKKDFVAQTLFAQQDDVSALDAAGEFRLQV